ncbi:MAG: sigma-70 family RNA polymerase sigma factor [Oscillibacter sp.]|nr:sigma-70 family RNA polymerase sigma factor [Oscillibacter sp.]
MATNSTGFENRSSEWIGDLTVWMQDRSGDNAEQLDRLRRGLRQARETELTPRQQEILSLYYDQGMLMSQIAEALGIHRSTVSRTLRRARKRLYHCLRYTL